ncbi:acetoin dehydrogenase complex, dihydrolipoamide dehydrogenase component [Bacillus cereus W]|uniref:Dihydrolipoyl dehydrogenase n=1 Tax=Bacillus thuringiensis serovar mexicanensis TaxID=180868 RepID=A0A242VZA7_BACTU|nr:MULTISPECIES: dihydrolipoyl dehydrogenase [Bacillus cereus group]EDX59202.1 acetoin dehydrogenase complex, dihydrolipoamide dehydrogenase component [Bacillus cereus W]EEM59607.1 Dihydrolipoyl dehydrogenase [Bacillus thuringiensis serovar monterrey BGSC 4AJ1]MEB9529093.1 dihydrolipoyl dehydrogenase [Bacillus anthracis]MEB9671708.1 dihydrolipoyl dehydrogenase [Bacillus anthracis]MEC0041632.1 dihydrolipoyl dehydrogenase [Bacillus anthracis]
MSKLVVIGGGPAGYVAAITAAQNGKDVTLIDEADLGGTCLNVGCMPTKSLLESAEVHDIVRMANNYGVTLNKESISVDWKQMQARKSQIVTQLVQGIQYLMKKNKIKVIQGKAKFETDHRLRVTCGDKEYVVDGEQFIIAAGSEPTELPFVPFDGKWILNSSHAMSIDNIPKSLLIVGGGVIGCEFASIYSRLGTKVTIIEMAPQLLPGEDEDIANILREKLENDGVEIFTGAALKGLNNYKKQTSFEYEGSIREANSEFVLISVGRKPRVQEIGLEKAGIQFSNKGIVVNKHMQTNVSHIYAAGDVIGGIQLAHVAFHEGTTAALHASGEDVKVNYHAVPRCIYTAPEIASVGLSEKLAREQYGDILIGEFPFTANGKALIIGEQMGKVKVIVEPKYQEIVGISIIGPHATELIGQGTVMIHTEVTADIMRDYIAAHPTLSESIHEALLQAVGHAVHA